MLQNVGYHWDCSDWARHSQTLPNITEVPGSEIPDSSSFHSNESNESRYHLHHPLPVLGILDPHRDIETLNEDNESDFGANSNPSRCLSPSLNALDSGNEEFKFTTGILNFLFLVGHLSKIFLTNNFQ